MAITLNHSPATYSSAHDILPFTVYESAKYGNTNYRYYCDIYIDSVFIKRLEAWPDPDNGRGFFDISKVVRDYIAVSFSPVASELRAQEMGSGAFFIDVVCKFGENDNGVITTDLLVDSSRRYYNHYNNRLVGSNTVLSDFLDMPLTNRPQRADNTVELTDEYCFIPYFPTDTDAITVTVTTHSEDGTTLSTQTEDITPAAANTLQLFNVAPEVINAAFGPGIISESVFYYNVKFMNPNIANEPTYKFLITCEAKFETYKLHFLNQYGGFETYPFRKVSKRRVEMEKKDVKQRGYSMDASGNVSFYDANNVYREQKSVYAVTFSEKLKLTTDFLSDAEYTWLSELILSPAVYIEENGYFLPVTIRKNDYEFKKRVTDKLTSLSLEIEYGGTYNTQFR